MKTILTVVLAISIATIAGHRSTAQTETPKAGFTTGPTTVALPMTHLTTPAEAVRMVIGNTVLADVSAYFVPEDAATALYFVLADVRILTASDFTANWHFAMVVPTAPPEGLDIQLDILGVDVFGKYRLKVIIVPN